MTPEQLKNSIFQYAIQGKLVEQRPEEGSAVMVYERIQEDKKQTKAKNGKKLPEIVDDELPFEIPDVWKWVRIGDVCNIINGFTPKRSNAEFWTNGTIPWFTIEDVRRQGRFIESTEQFISEKALSKDSERMVPAETVLLCCTASVGEYAYAKIPLTTNQQFNALVIREEYKEFISSMYIYQFVQTLKGQLISNAGKTTFNFLSVGKLSEMLVPVPPLKEQHRIVDKIEELLPYVDRYAEAYEKLEQFNAKIPDDMKKSILQYAIQGKLVEQRPDEGTAEELYQQIQDEKQKLIKEGKIKKEKPLAEIKEDESLLDIPDSWKWCYLGDLFSHTAGKALNSKDTNGIKHKYITTSNVYWDHFELANLKEMYYTEDEIVKYSVKYGDLLVLEGGDVGRSAIWDLQESYCIQNHIHRLRPYIDIDVKYFYYAMMYFKFKGDISGKGIGIKGLSANALHCINIPLPPLEEQHRIVAKIEELLPYCERLSMVEK